MMDFWMTPWRASLTLTAAALETTLVVQKSLASVAGFGGTDRLDENRLRDAFHAAADVNLRRWGDTAEMIQNLPTWMRDMTSMPGDLMTDWFDHARRGHDL
ncbi:MAG: hypothetical protein KDA53_05475 [Hyphomonas sp.]|nr:hypothetical protein [Hyphomonas sp.]